MTVKRGRATTSKHRVSHSHSKQHAKPARQLLLQKIQKPGILEEEIARPPHEMGRSIEDSFVPYSVHQGKYSIPMGIKFLIGYLTFLASLYIVSFIFNITFPTTILFSKLITGPKALIFNAVLLVIVLFIIYGFWKRKPYAFDLSVGFFGFAALNALVSFLLFDSSEHPIFRKMLLLSFVSLVVMDMVIVWYILHEKKYFYAERFKERPFHHRDKVFLYTIVTFWIITLLIGVTLGVQFYKDTTKVIDNTIKEINGDYYRGQLLCEKKTGPEQDICTLVVATALSVQQRPESELAGMCASIKSDFYRFTCTRSISG